MYLGRFPLSKLEQLTKPISIWRNKSVNFTKFRTKGKAFSEVCFPFDLLFVYFNCCRVAKCQFEGTNFTWMPKMKGKDLYLGCIFCHCVMGWLILLSKIGFSQQYYFQPILQTCCYVWTLAWWFSHLHGCKAG